jgi:glycosyltransferase involved in cell wall biosynthesis
MLHSFASHPHVRQPWRRLALAVERSLDRLTDQYIAASEAMIHHGVENQIFTSDKVTRIANAVDIAAIDRIASVPAGERRRSLGLSDHEFVIGFVGRLEQAKGCEYLLRAAAKIRNRRGMRFVICGDGSLRDDLESLAAELELTENVLFLGWRNDVWQVMQAFDIMAMPSLWESFGLAAAEAMTLGKPVVASAVDGLKEVVQDRETGLLAPSKDPLALAWAIETLAKHPSLREMMGRQGRTRAEQFYSLDRMIRDHELVYDELLGKVNSQPAKESPRKAA